MLGYNEHKFALDNLEVVNEFDTKSFQANAASYITGDIKDLNFKTSFYSKAVADTIESVKSISLDKEAIRDFAKLNLNVANLSPIRPIDYSDVTSISPSYLSYSKKVLKLVNDMVGGNTIGKETVDKLIRDDYNYTKKNIVKTSLDYRLPVTEIIKHDDVKKIIPTAKYITSTILPFVNGFEKVKMELSNEGKNILLEITNAEKDIELIISKVKAFEMAEGNSDDTKKVDYLEYNGVYNIIDLMSYVSYMYMRKVNNFKTNVINCNRLYTDIVNGNNLMVHESTEIGIDPGMISATPANLGFNLMQGNVAAYEVLANKVYELYTGKNKVEDIDDVIRVGDDIPEHINGEYVQGQSTYNAEIYLNIKKVFIGIGQGLYNIDQVPDGLMVRKDDLIYGSGFKRPLKDKYRSQLDDIVDVSKIQYADIANAHGIDRANLNELLSEVKDFANNMQSIANEAIDTYAVLEEIIKRFEHNINNEFKDVDCVKEIEEWASMFADEYKEFVSEVAGRFMERLAVLAIALNKIYNNGTYTNADIPPVVADAYKLFDVNDYTEGVIDSDIEYNKLLNINEFESLEKAYQILRIKKETGMNLMFEADEVEKPNDRAKFMDKISSSTGNFIEKLKAMISKWFDTVSNKFQDAVNLLANEDRLKNVKDNQNKILNEIDYSTIPALQIYPYENMGKTEMIDNLNKLRNNIKAMTPQVIQNIESETDLYQKLFTFVDNFTPTGDIKNQFMWFNKTGSAANGERKSIVGNDLKVMVQNEMVPYVNEYTTTFANNLKTSINQVKDDLSNTVSAYKTVSTTPQQPATTTAATAESALFEAEEPNKNTQGSMGKKAGWMNKAVQLYCGCVLNAARDRYSDYLGILSQLASVNTQTPTV